MTHLWVRAEQRPNEERVGVTPDGVKALLDAGLRVTVEQSSVRAIPIDGYRETGAEIAAENSWPDSPQDAIIFGLKELPEDGTPLPHSHIMFGHAFKGQHSGRALLERFKAGGGTLYDLEYLVNPDGRRVAALGRLCRGRRDAQGMGLPSTGQHLPTRLHLSRQGRAAGRPAPRS